MVLSRDYTYTVSERHSIFFRLMDTREREREGERDCGRGIQIETKEGP